LSFVRLWIEGGVREKDGFVREARGKEDGKERTEKRGGKGSQEEGERGVLREDERWPC
jgi:hypothetical protein